MSPAEFKAARLRLGLSIYDLGSLLGVDPRTIRKWEADPAGSNARPPNPVASRVMSWLESGFRPPEWPAVPSTDEEA
ncbi:hypothetical protein ASF65_00145 [Aureimonas sp. Leaf324]|jgi:DNA-binding transcriptional regulator YiaG|nr:hypothetical protein ASF65_00145 [Aureimonas sp. Leaf324]